MLRGMFGHLKTTLHHKLYVFYYCCFVGLYWRGLVHDLSKFSLTEFIPSAKYYMGTCSPQRKEREANNGFSFVGIHHVGRNKHHYQYWIDYNRTNTLVHVMPFTYTLEFICDSIAAGRTYAGKEFKLENPYNFFLNAMNMYQMHPATKEFVLHYFELFAKIGTKALNRKEMKQTYECICAKYDSVIYIPTNFEGLAIKED